MNTSAERNALCPCGSGRKYKNCCMLKTATTARRSKSAATGFIILILVFAAIAMVIKMVQSPSTPVQSVAPASAPVLPGTLQPQPPGPVPEGKVWSPEHGHWHDAQAGDDASAHQMSPIAPPARAAFTPGPPPPGPAPEGKEWSYEHGHWHNIPGYIDSKTAIKNTTVREILPVESSESVEPESEAGDAVETDAAE